MAFSDKVQIGVVRVRRTENRPSHAKGAAMKKLLGWFCLVSALLGLIWQGLSPILSAPWQMTLTRIENGVPQKPRVLNDAPVIFLGHNVRAELGSHIVVTERGADLVGSGGWYVESDEDALLRQVAWWMMFAASALAGVYFLRSARQESRKAGPAAPKNGGGIRLVNGSPSASS